MVSYYIVVIACIKIESLILERFEEGKIKCIEIIEAHQGKCIK